VYGTAAPVVFGLAWMAARVLGVRRDALAARAGVVADAGQPLLWFHGASAGELAAAVNLADLLRAHGYRFTAAYTAANRAGVDFVVRQKRADTIAAFGPWDAPRWVARALDHWRPAALLLVETELWPRLILEAWRRGVPVLGVSARIYPRDVRRYRAIRALMAPALRRMAAVLAQNDVERERFIALGAPPERCAASGNLKYLAPRTATMAAETLRAELGLGIGEPLVAFGSLHREEIPLVLAALEPLRDHTVRFIIAPRHRSAGGAIVKACAHRGWRLARRTGLSGHDWRILLLDTMGELTAAYAVASVAVVGGAFGRGGGHNLFEPLIQGTPVLFGRNVEHVEDEAVALVTATPEAQVRDASQLGDRLTRWLRDPAHRSRVLALQQRALPDAAAIAQRYLAALSPWLQSVSSAADGHPSIRRQETAAPHSERVGDRFQETSPAPPEAAPASAAGAKPVLSPVEGRPRALSGHTRSGGHA